MWFLYVLECMLRGLFTLVGDSTNKPLITTGEPMTKGDIGVCAAGCFTVVTIILGTAYLVRFFKNRNAKMK